MQDLQNYLKQYDVAYFNFLNQNITSFSSGF